MSYIKDFKELHISEKAAVLTIICQMPFFFIAIYLFNHTIIENIDSSYMFQDIDFYYLLAVCFVFSLTWFFINIAGASLRTKLNGNESKAHEFYLSSFVISIFYLSFSIVLALCKNPSFAGFISAVYSFRCSMLFVTFFKYLVQPSK